MKELCKNCGQAIDVNQGTLKSTYHWRHVTGSLFCKMNGEWRWAEVAGEAEHLLGNSTFPNLLRTRRS